MENDIKLKETKKASWVTVFINIFLTLSKGAVGIIAGSLSVISDAVHSLSDVLSTFVVMAGVKAACKKPDKEHNYGHDKLESVASKILALMLLAVGLYLGYAAADKIIRADYMENDMGALMIAVTVFSVLACEFMYWYKRHYAKKLNSSSLKADAWHHRSDAFSSVAVLIGLIGYFAGVKFLESAATIAVAALIIWVAVKIYIESERSMTDTAAPEETVGKIRQIIAAQTGVLRIDVLRTRVSGSKLFVDAEVAVDKDSTLVAAHDVAENIHAALEGADLDIIHAGIHVNPYNEESETHNET